MHDDDDISDLQIDPDNLPQWIRDKLSDETSLAATLSQQFDEQRKQQERQDRLRRFRLVWLGTLGVSIGATLWEYIATEDVFWSLWLSLLAVIWTARRWKALS